MQVKDLPDNPISGVVLHCGSCGKDFSAWRGDYFLEPPTDVFMCCGTPMELAQRTVVYKTLTREEASHA